VENVNAQVDELIHLGVLRRLLAFTELKFSNSMIEAWWRSLKHQWLFLHSLDSVATVRRLVAFYVDEHNRVLPHSAFRGQTPDEPPWQPPMFHPVRNICGSHPPDDRELRSLGYRVERLTIPASNPARVRKIFDPGSCVSHDLPRSVCQSIRTSTNGPVRRIRCYDGSPASAFYRRDPGRG
jgi:hypothetical protein